MERLASTEDGRSRCKCKCDCGATVEVFGFMLRTKRTTSCGCYQRERAEYGQIMRWAQAKAAVAR